MPHGPVGWSFRDLTATDGAPLVGGIQGYSVDGTSSECLVCVNAEDGSIHELARAGGEWRHTNLSQMAGVAEGAIQPPVGYAFVAQGTRHVIYVGQRRAAPPPPDIFELWQDGSGWHHKNLTSEADAPPISFNSRPSAYVCEFDGTQHVVYVGEDAHIHELWWDHDGWHWNDLTAASGSPLAEVTLRSGIGCSSSARRSQFVHFMGVDGKLHGMRWVDGAWSRNDPVVPGGLVPPAFRQLVNYCAGDGTLHVVFVGQDGHLYELSFDGHSWSVEQPSGAIGPIFSGRTVGLAAYPDDAQRTRHIVAAHAGVSIENRIDGFWRDASAWYHIDISAASGCPLPSADLCTGYALRTQKRQHMAYVSSIGHLIVVEWRPGPDLHPPAPPLPPSPFHPR